MGLNMQKKKAMFQNLEPFGSNIHKALEANTYWALGGGSRCDKILSHYIYLMNLDKHRCKLQLHWWVEA